MIPSLLIAAVLAFTALLYMGHGYWAWVSVAFLLLVACGLSWGSSSLAFLAATAAGIAMGVIFGIPAIRR